MRLKTAHGRQLQMGKLMEIGDDRCLSASWSQEIPKTGRYIGNH
jgi:hypothetical protein